MTRKLFYTLSIVSMQMFMPLLLPGCGGNSSVPENIDTKEPVKGPPNEYKFTGQFLYAVEFEQGRVSTYNMIEGANVPAPGKPVLSFRDLPEGATFDGTILSWSPSCDLPKDFFKNRDYRVIPVMAVLRSDMDENNYVERSILLIVNRFIEFTDRKCGQF